MTRPKTSEGPTLAADARPFNRFGLDYRKEAERLGPPVVPIIDGHSHINGRHASLIYKEAREAYGVVHTWSQTQLSQTENVLQALGDTVSFVAIPEYMAEDRLHAHSEGFLENITHFHKLGARMVKFWCGPRGRDYAKDAGGDPLLMTLDHPIRLRAMEHAASLGYMFMAHIADPDTWFQGKYTDSSYYGTKRDQYEPLERLADQYTMPWLIAHMGGWPEDLAFLTGLLDDHPNLILDTSATKWMVRELSRHPSEEFNAFLRRFQGRIVFGSDIVSHDTDLEPTEGPMGTNTGASSPSEAFDLYASRYYALRTMFETDYRGESPIADPDLHMLDPDGASPMDAPPMVGHSVPEDVLRIVYRQAALDTLHKWQEDHR